MKTHYLLFAVVLFPTLACEKPQQVTTGKTSPPVVETEEVKVSIESSIERVIAEDKAGVESAHQKGNKNTVGLMNGKDWVNLPIVQRVAYIRGIADLESFHSLISAVAWRELETQRKAQGLQHQAGTDSSYRVGLLASDNVSDRLQKVVIGPSFGDLAEAVTKFYQNNPLLKDRPVLWVLSVALYKQLKAAEPRPASGSVEEMMAGADDTISITLKKVIAPPK